MEYRNEFHDGPLSGSVLITTMPLHQIRVQTEQQTGARIMPLATHHYECDEEDIGESLTIRRFVLEGSEKCDHGVVEGDWCPVCNVEMKQARQDPENA